MKPHPLHEIGQVIDTNGTTGATVQLIEGKDIDVSRSPKIKIDLSNRKILLPNSSSESVRMYDRSTVPYWRMAPVYPHADDPFRSPVHRQPQIGDLVVLQRSVIGDKRVKRVVESWAFRDELRLVTSMLSDPRLLSLWVDNQLVFQGDSSATSILVPMIEGPHGFDTINWPLWKGLNPHFKKWQRNRWKSADGARFSVCCFDPDEILEVLDEYAHFLPAEMLNGLIRTYDSLAEVENLCIHRPYAAAS